MLKQCGFAAWRRPVCILGFSETGVAFGRTLLPDIVAPAADAPYPFACSDDLWIRRLGILAACLRNCWFTA